MKKHCEHKGQAGKKKCKNCGRKLPKLKTGPLRYILNN